MFVLPDQVKDAHRSPNTHVRIEMWHEGAGCHNGLECSHGKCDIITINKCSDSTVKVVYTDYHTATSTGYITYKQALDKSMLLPYIRTLAYMIGSDSLDKFQYVQYNFPMFPCIVLSSGQLSSMVTRRHLEKMAKVIYDIWFEGLYMPAASAAAQPEQGQQEQRQPEQQDQGPPGQEPPSASYTFPNFLT